MRAVTPVLDDGFACHVDGGDGCDLYLLAEHIAAILLPFAVVLGWFFVGLAQVGADSFSAALLR